MRDQSQTQRRWQQRIAAQQSSGLSVTEFCRRERINKASFYGWKRRVEAIRPKSFVELTVLPAGRRTAKAELPSIEVRLANGRSLLVPVDFDGDHLIELITAVEAIA